MQGEVSRKIGIYKKLIDSEDQKTISELLIWFWDKSFDGEVPVGEEFNPDWLRDVSIKITKKMGKDDEDVLEIEYRDRVVERVEMPQLDLFENHEEVLTES